MDIMNVCDFTNNTVHLASHPNETLLSFAVHLCVNSLGALASALVFIVVLWTPSLRGTTGSLILNAQVASFISQLQVAIFSLVSPVGMPAHLFYISLTRSTRFASSVFLTLMNVNMYLAVCRSTVRNSMNRSSAGMMIAAAWLLIIIFWLIGLPGQFYSPTCVDGVLTIAISKQGMWIPVLTVVCAFLPMACDFLCLWRVSKAFSALPPNLTFKQAQDRKRKLMKVKLIHVITVMSAFCIVPLVIMNSASEFASEGLDFVLKKLTAAVSMLYNIYEISRLIIYSICYRPIWEATKLRLCSARGNKVIPFGSECQGPSSSIQPKESRVLCIQHIKIDFDNKITSDFQQPHSSDLSN